MADERSRPRFFEMLRRRLRDFFLANQAGSEADANLPRYVPPILTMPGFTPTPELAAVAIQDAAAVNEALAQAAEQPHTPLSIPEPARTPTSELHAERARVIHATERTR